MNENLNSNKNSDKSSEKDTKAFKWDWESDGSQAEVEKAKALAEEAKAQAEKAKKLSEDMLAGNCDPTPESKDAETADDAHESSPKEPPCTDTEQEKDACAEKRPVVSKKKHSPLLISSIILSACSILLLVAISAAVMLGLIEGSGVVQILVSDNGPTASAEGEASSALLEEVMNSVVVISTNTPVGAGTGSGIIITENGYIATNYHVIEDASSITVFLYGSDQAFPAEVVGFHENDDIAVIKIASEGLRPAIFARSSDCRVGEKVYAIGSPEGAEFGWSVTQGIISCPLRRIMLYDKEGILEKKMNVVQTDTPVNHGNSGGPLINVRGEVVGIVTLKLSDSAGMGFALPSDGALTDIFAIIRQGHANDVDSGISSGRPLLGITGVGVVEGTWYEDMGTQIKEVDKAWAERYPNRTFYAEVSGVYVSNLTPGLDAQTKLKVGDIITEVDGVRVYNIYQIMSVVNNMDAGDSLSIKYYRDGQYGTRSITLGYEAE